MTCTSPKSCRRTGVVSRRELGEKHGKKAMGKMWMPSDQRILGWFWVPNHPVLRGTLILSQDCAKMSPRWGSSGMIFLLISYGDIWDIFHKSLKPQFVAMQKKQVQKQVLRRHPHCTSTNPGDPAVPCCGVRMEPKWFHTSIVTRTEPGCHTRTRFRWVPLKRAMWKFIGVVENTVCALFPLWITLWLRKDVHPKSHS